MNDSDISDIVTRSYNIWPLHSSYIAVTRSYIWYVTQNVFTTFMCVFVYVCVCVGVSQTIQHGKR